MSTRTGEPLTARERQVVDAVAGGGRNAEIAAGLGISTRTVETHLARAYRKLGVSSRLELAAGRRSDLFDEPPPVQYAYCGELALAFQVHESTATTRHAPDVLVVPGFGSHLDILWDDPDWRRFLRALTAVGRVITFDKRGTGLSDPFVGAPTLEERMEDVTSVLDAAGCRRPVLFGMSEGGPMCATFAATYPDRICALVLYGSAISGVGSTRQRRMKLLSIIDEGWGRGNLTSLLWPSRTATPDGRRWLGRFERCAVSPGGARALMTLNLQIDATEVLPLLRVPTLVLHRPGDCAVPYTEGIESARRIPHARLVDLPGIDHVPWAGDPAPIVAALTDHLREVDVAGEPPSAMLVAVLAVAQVGETGRNAALRRIRAAGGRVLADTVVLTAVFSGCSRAAEVGLDIAESVGAAVGLSAGECDVPARSVTGPPVQEAARLSHAAAAGTAFVSPLVAALGAARGVSFREHGGQLLAERPRLDRTAV